jgi:hypothetical protein
MLGRHMSAMDVGVTKAPMIRFQVSARCSPAALVASVDVRKPSDQVATSRSGLVSAPKQHYVKQSPEQSRGGACTGIFSFRQMGRSWRSME